MFVIYKRKPKIHQVYIDEENFKMKINGNKNYEIVLYDIDYQINDLLEIYEVDYNDICTGNVIVQSIEQIIFDEKFLKSRYVILQGNVISNGKSFSNI